MPAGKHGRAGARARYGCGQGLPHGLLERALHRLAAAGKDHIAERMLAVLPHEPRLSQLHPAHAPAPRNPLTERPTTKFHARGERLRRGAWDFAFVRRAV